MDLAKDQDLQVAVAEIDKKRLALVKDERVRKIQADLSDAPELMALVSDYDLVINAVPGYIGFRTLKQCIEAGRDVVDIAFYPEDVFSLSELARSNGVRVIADMGVAPGMSNLLVGYAAAKLSEVDHVGIYVGGLPKIRRKPWEFKVVFSPTDVIEEYTRPARMVEKGEVIVKPALTDVELIDFERPGTLEAFNSDGLRSLLYTIKAGSLVEKTLRYPGYAEKIRLLADNGFFRQDTVEVSGHHIRPVDLTGKLLFDQWKLGEDETDITVMRVIVEGKHDSGRRRYVYELYDEKDPATGIHSMARTTGYAATMAARLLLKGFYQQKGITVPEMLGRHEQNVLYMLEGLKDRDVVYRERTEDLE